ncbi:peptidase S8 [Paenibacillus sp. Marseille-P2973]|uniref:S8 family peptidase n=1 Tax=Paenibacillus sp. Marseille-P2973 TaxID=1871032 RepID=UPI001B37F86C|nr:S8 family peptidase [Paenibacillus sp. Marseille-P2973]MBQ4897527.1 peptidase S8 [Paenibacillus sp. Marseille-P2973]
MRWQRWAALALAGVAAVALYNLIPDSSAPSANRQAEIKTVKNPAEEHKLKQMMLKRDMTATERLARLDAKRHLRLLADKFAAAQPGKLPTDAGDLQKDHKQFPSLRWYTGKQEREFRAAKFRLEAAEQKQLDTYLGFARNALRKGNSYESPGFPQGNPKYVVAAEPAQGKNQQGMIAVLDMGILSRVQDHQHKNLRLISYPKEGKYKIESVHADTLQDITVKTGHDNEKASHYYENEIVVTFGKAPSAADMKKIERDLRCNPAQNIGNTYIFRSESMDMKQLTTYFKKHWKPNHVEPHYLYMTNENVTGLGDENPEIPNDLLFSEYQWNLPIIETNRGWKLSKGSNDVIVGVVDTGVDLKHPDLQGRLLKGYNVVSPGDDPVDDVGHGTHVAGIISANVNNNEGIAGMMWGGKILPVKALDKTGSGTTYSVAQGIIWATDHGAKVINMSLGNYADAQFLHEAIKYAFDRDVVLIAATGNDNTERPGYPAAYPEVLSVSATDYHLQRASFSNYGDYVDVMAPGESIASTYPDNQYAALSGTSMASPHVSALAALIRSVNPKLKNTEVMDIIRKNVIDLGDPGHDKYFGYGQIDVFSALESAQGNSAPLQFWPQSMQRKMNKILNDAM